MRARRMLDLSVYVGSALEFMIMLFVWTSFSLGLELVNLLVALNMVVTIGLASVYTYLRRGIVMERVRRHARRGRDWLRYALTFGGS